MCRLATGCGSFPPDCERQRGGDHVRSPTSVRPALSPVAGTRWHTVSICRIRLCSCKLRMGEGGIRTHVYRPRVGAKGVLGLRPATLRREWAARRRTGEAFWRPSCPGLLPGSAPRRHLSPPGGRRLPARGGAPQRLSVSLGGLSGTGVSAARNRAPGPRAVPHRKTAQDAACSPNARQSEAGLPRDEPAPPLRAELGLGGRA